MYKANPSITPDLARIFRDWAGQCTAMAAPLPKDSRVQDLFRQASESLALLGQADPATPIVLVKPIITYSKVEWMAQAIDEWPAPDRKRGQVDADLQAVRAWLDENRKR